MKNLFDALRVKEVKGRIAQLRPDSQRQWGVMAPAQALAHCSSGIQIALGDIKPRRKLIGIAIGWAIKPLALRDDEPLRGNSPTVDDLVIQDDRNLVAEEERLSVYRPVRESGPKSCTTHPHSFFGRLTPQEWAVHMYKHLGHHLRQFGV